MAKYIARNYGGRSPEQRQSDRRQRFLEAGLDTMICSSGTATVAAIISAAGLSSRYFYECFDGRDHLLIGIFDWIVQQCALAAATAIEVAAASPRSPNEAVVIGVMDALTADPRWARFVLDPAIGGVGLALRRRQLRGDIAFVLREMQTDNTSSADSKSRAVQSECLVAGVTGVVLAWLGGYLPLTREDLVQYCARYVDESLLWR